jgi:GntR family transcriptional regulator
VAVGDVKVELFYQPSSSSVSFQLEADRELGHAPAHFREDVRARMPQPEETEALDLPSSGSPVVDIVRTAFTDAGVAVEVNEMTLDASAYTLRYDLSA